VLAVAAPAGAIGVTIAPMRAAAAANRATRWRDPALLLVRPLDGMVRMPRGIGKTPPSIEALLPLFRPRQNT
jgi:hypothetical protein